MDSNQISELVAIALNHQWLLFTAALIGLVVRLLKLPHIPPPLDQLPAKARPLIALALGFVAAGLQHVAAGVPWRQALAEGLVAALAAICGHDIVIEWLRGGRELGAPSAPVQAQPATEPVVVPEAAPTPRDGSAALLPRAPRLDDVDSERRGER